jgi:hypothetical protein
LVDAAAMIEREPVALQLRFLQTLSEIATNKKSRTILPFPLEFIRPFFTGDKAARGGGQEASATGDKALNPG